MARLLARLGTRCQEHPHRPYAERCDRCGLPFCAECLSPSERGADGTREWFCDRCLARMDEATRRRASEAALAYRAARAAARARTVGRALAAVVVLLAVTGGASFAVARTLGRATDHALPERAAACGDLTRIRSIGAIGTQGPEDAVNLLTYPQRARVLSVMGANSSALDSTGADALVDECDAGWRLTESPGDDAVAQLPITITLDTHRDGAYVQRIALLQDPHAPRAAWVRTFRLLASPSADGDDFTPLPLDREPELRESTEAQWFELVTGPSAQVRFPATFPIRRLRLTILSTWGEQSPGDAMRAQGVSVRAALGEIAVYGPDLEVVVGGDGGALSFGPAQISALAGRPKWVFFFNRANTPVPHDIVTTGLAQNLRVRLEDRQVASGSFTAGVPGTYAFFCRTPGHRELGLQGTIVVR